MRTADWDRAEFSVSKICYASEGRGGGHGGHALPRGLLPIHGEHGKFRVTIKYVKHIPIITPSKMRQIRDATRIIFCTFVFILKRTMQSCDQNQSIPVIYQHKTKKNGSDAPGVSPL